MMMTEQEIKSRIKSLSSSLEDSQEHEQICWLEKRISYFQDQLTVVRESITESQGD